MEIFFIRHGESTHNLAGTEPYDSKIIELTDKGKAQAQETGKHLKIYGKFDMLYCSPILRCVQTTRIIAKNMNYTGEIQENGLLIEAGELNHGLSGLSGDEQDLIMKKNKKLVRLEKKMKDEKNEFKLYKLNIMYEKEAEKYLKIKPSLEERDENYNTFLNTIDRSAKRIGVVCHSGTINGILRIITGINPHNNLVRVYLSTNQLLAPKLFQSSSILILNCCIMGVLLKDGVFELVILPNTNHLSDLNEIDVQSKQKGGTISYGINKKAYLELFKGLSV